MNHTHAAAALAACRASWKQWPVSVRIQVACQAVSLAGDALLHHRRLINEKQSDHALPERGNEVAAALRVLFGEAADQRVALLEQVLADDREAPPKRP